MTKPDETQICEMRETLVTYLYGEGSPEESRVVETHIQVCKTCAEELTAFEGVRKMLQKWQVEELPEVYLAAKGRGRSTLALLKELFRVSPAWAKVLGGVAMAMFVLAIFGTSISIGPGGFSISLRMFRYPNVQTPNTLEELKSVRAELNAAVNAMIADSERHQRENLKLELATLESGLQTTRAAEIAKLDARIQQQRDLIKALERDIDRREGLALSDILFSETPANSSGASGGSD